MMHRELPDFLRPGLQVVFVGINPGKMSADLGHYYAHPANRFWDFLFESGLTPERLCPEDDHRVLDFGIGLTDVVKRSSRSSSELRKEEYQRRISGLTANLQGVKPRVIAFNGKTAYEGFCGRVARLGWQEETIAGARVFVLPSTSPRHARMKRAEKLQHFRELAQWLKSKIEEKNDTGT